MGADKGTTSNDASSLQRANRVSAPPEHRRFEPQQPSGLRGERNEGWREAEETVRRYWRALENSQRPTQQEEQASAAESRGTEDVGGWLTEAIRRSDNISQARDRQLEIVRRDVSLHDSPQLAWASAILHMGPHPDDYPSSNDLRRASEELHRAAESSDADIRIPLAKLRLRLTETQVATHRQTNSAEEAWALLDECRLHVPQGSADARELDHAQARLLMAESRWKAAYERLTALAQNARDLDAQVAALHCEYILSNAAFKLAPRLQALLQVCESRDGKPALSGAHPHTTMHLQAALLADQGAIFENMDLGKAFASYRRALELRPRMIFVQRALLRCLAADNRLQQALESGEGLLSGAPSESADPQAPPPVGLMVEVGRLLAERDRLKDAKQRLQTVTHEVPAYAFAHEARIATEREWIRETLAGEEQEEAYRLLCQSAAEALEQRDGAPRWNGVRVELGETHLATGNTAAALALFEQAAKDDRPAVRSRARAGAINAHRLAGRLDLALAEARGAPAPPPSAATAPDGSPEHIDEESSPMLEAIGLLHIELSEYGHALRCFERALELRPQLLTSIRGRARALRLLGRTQEAWLYLEQRAATLPSQLAKRLENERGWAALNLPGAPHERARDARAHFDRLLTHSGGYRCNRNSLRESAHRGLIAAAAQAGGSLSLASHSEIEDLLERARADLQYESPNLLAEAAAATLRRRRLMRARELFARAQSAQANASLWGTRLPLLLFQAHELIAAHALEEARETLEQILTLGGTQSSDGVPSGDPRVGLLTARLHAARCDWSSALDSYLHILHSRPHNVEARIGAACIFLRREEHANALAQLNELPVDTLNVRAVELRAWTLTGLHEATHPTGPRDSPELQEAARLCMQIRESEPNRTLALECLAEIAALRGQPTTVDLYLEEAARSAIRPADIARSRARLLLQMARGEDAFELLTNVDAQEREEDASLTHLLGLAHAAQGHNDEAIAGLRRTIAGEPSNVAAHLHLATILHNETRREEALATLGEGLERADGRRWRMRLLLARASIRATHAEDHDGRERDILLDESLTDIARAAGQATTDSARAEVDYHRGVLLHRRGHYVQAQRALRQSVKRDRNREDASHALALLKEKPGTDTNERLTLIGAKILGGAALVLLVLAITATWAHAGWRASAFKWEPLSWIVLAMLVTVVVAATLPRLAGLEVANQVKLSLQQITPKLESDVNLALPKLPATSRLTVLPTSNLFTEPPSDKAGAE